MIQKLVAVFTGTLFVLAASAAVSSDVDTADAAKRLGEAKQLLGYACGYVAGQIDTYYVITGHMPEGVDETDTCLRDVAPAVQALGFKFPLRAAARRSAKEQ